MENKLHRLAKGKLAEIRALKIVPTDEEILQINDLARVAQYGASDPRFLLYQYKRIGNLKVYPLSLGAKLFVLYTIPEMFPENETLQSISWLYAAAYSREPEKFEFETAAHARETLTKWGKKISATPDEAVEAIRVLSSRELVTAQTKPDPMKERDAEFAPEEPLSYVVPLIGLLMHFFPGQEEKYWLWSVSEERCSDLLRQAVKMKNGGESIDVHDPAIVALYRLNGYVNEIKARAKNG